MATAGAPVLGPNPNQVTVELSNVPDIQNVVVSLNGVKDSTGANLGPQSARLGVLVGDTNQDRFVMAAMRFKHETALARSRPKATSCRT